MQNEVPSHQTPSIVASIFHYIFMFCPNAFQNISFSPFGRPRAPTNRRIQCFWRFLAPLGFGGVPKSAKIVQVTPKCLIIMLLALTLFMTYFQGPFRSAPGHHFFRFLIDLGCIFHDFRSDLGCRFRQSLCTPSTTGLLTYRKNLAN